MAPVNVPSVPLNNGKSIPIIGLGTWKSPAGKVYEAVKYAIEVAGYRHIDCAFAYGNEDEVGRALKEVIDSGVVKRSDLFITSKLWNTYHQRDRVQKCLDKSLAALQLEYLDLYLLHWPLGYQEGYVSFPKDVNGQVLVSDIDYVQAYLGLEDALKTGKVKSIGVSNFNSKQITRLLSETSVVPVVNQVECHPYLNQSKLIEFCKQHKIVLTAYSPLGSPDRPFAKPEDPSLLQDPRLETIATKYGKSTAQILIRYQVQRGVVVIPKSITPERILANIQVFDFELTSGELQSIDSFNNNFRFVTLKGNGPLVYEHKYYPFNEPY